MTICGPGRLDWYPGLLFVFLVLASKALQEFTLRVMISKVFSQAITPVAMNIDTHIFSETSKRLGRRYW